MSCRTIAIGGLPPSALVRVHVSTDPDTYLPGVANADGYVKWDEVDDRLGPSDVFVSAVGYQPYHESVTWRSVADTPAWTKPINHQVTMGVELPALKLVVPPPPPLPKYAIKGIDFIEPTAGNRIVLNGQDGFMDFRLYLDGQSLTPFFAEGHDLGFNLRRVFFMGSKAQNQVMDLRPSELRYYDGVRPFVELLNAQGFVVLATIFVDAQDVMPDVGLQKQHWSRMIDLFRGTSTILSGGNEWRKNGFDPGNLPNPNLIWSRGSDLGDEAPYRPYGNVAEFHPRRDMPASVMDTVASPVFIHGTNGLTGPLIIDEPPKMGTNGSGSNFGQPRECYRFARHYSTECAAAVFHNYFGQRGQLMDAPTRECAAAWSKGMRL